MVVREILWTKRANNSFNEIIDYITLNFNKKVAKAFILSTYDHLDRLAKYPKIGIIQEIEKGIRGFIF